jgi:hAT family protein
VSKSFQVHVSRLNSYLVLDPRISYAALKDEFNDDAALTADLEASKIGLESYFNDNYIAQQPIPLLTATSSTLSIFSDSTASVSSSKTSRSPQKNFTSRFNQRKRTPSNELQDFWGLPQEDFDTCDPLQWWHGRRSQFPNLSRLARDIFSIPGRNLKSESFQFIFILIDVIFATGSAVAVERVFSGGRDTISLRRASLKPETIRILMIVKTKLILAREEIKSNLDHLKVG